MNGAQLRPHEEGVYELLAAEHENAAPGTSISEHVQNSIDYAVRKHSDVEPDELARMQTIHVAHEIEHLRPDDPNLLHRVTLSCCHDEAKSYVVAVTDTGIGIDEARMQELKLMRNPKSKESPEGVCSHFATGLMTPILSKNANEIFVVSYLYCYSRSLIKKAPMSFVRAKDHVNVGHIASGQNEKGKDVGTFNFYSIPVETLQGVELDDVVGDDTTPLSVIRHAWIGYNNIAHECGFKFGEAKGKVHGTSVMTYYTEQASKLHHDHAITDQFMETAVQQLEIIHREVQNKTVKFRTLLDTSKAKYTGNHKMLHHSNKPNVIEPKDWEKCASALFANKPSKTVKFHPATSVVTGCDKTSKRKFWVRGYLRCEDGSLRQVIEVYKQMRGETKVQLLSMSDEDQKTAEKKIKEQKMDACVFEVFEDPLKESEATAVSKSFKFGAQIKNFVEERQRGDPGEPLRNVVLGLSGNFTEMQFIRKVSNYLSKDKRHLLSKDVPKQQEFLQQDLSNIRVRIKFDKKYYGYFGVSATKNTPVHHANNDFISLLFGLFLHTIGREQGPPPITLPAPPPPGDRCGLERSMEDVAKAPRKKEFSQCVKDATKSAQNNMCYLCGLSLGHDDAIIQYDHLDNRSGQNPHAQENCAAVHSNCHSIKTQVYRGQAKEPFKGTDTEIAVKRRCYEAMEQIFKNFMSHIKEQGLPSAGGSAMCARPGEEGPVGDKRDRCTEQDEHAPLDELVHVKKQKARCTEGEPRAATPAGGVPFVL
jgi:hypothetical protein